MSSVSILGFMQSLVNNPAGEEQKTPHSDNNSSDDIVSLVANKVKFGPGERVHTSIELCSEFETPHTNSSDNLISAIKKGDSELVKKILKSKKHTLNFLKNVFYSFIINPDSVLSDSLMVLNKYIDGLYSTCRHAPKLELPKTNHTYLTSFFHEKITKVLSECPLNKRNDEIIRILNVYSRYLSYEDQEKWLKKISLSRSINELTIEERIAILINDIRTGDYTEVYKTLSSDSLSIKDLERAHSSYLSSVNPNTKIEAFLALDSHIRYRKYISQEEESASKESKTDSDMPTIERNSTLPNIDEMLDILEHVSIEISYMKRYNIPNRQTKINKSVEIAKNWMKALGTGTCDQTRLVIGINTFWPNLAGYLAKGG